eukprot:9870817-Alexandrium_andersonii.AAC.1
MATFVEALVAKQPTPSSGPEDCSDAQSLRSVASAPAVLLIGTSAEPPPQEAPAQQEAAPAQLEETSAQQAASARLQEVTQQQLQSVADT